MRIKNSSQIKIGMIVYYANCIGKIPFVDKPRKITSLPYQHESIDSLFVDYKDEYGTDTFSLRDCNVQKNGYNKHRLYTNEAEAYLKYMKRRNLIPKCYDYDIDYYDDNLHDDFYYCFERNCNENVDARSKDNV